MKVLLVVPPEENYVEASANQRIDRKREPRPKLGILYVATYLKTAQPDIELKVLDCPSEGMSFNEYELFIGKFTPDLVGITAVTFTIIDALKTARLTRKICSKARVCIGGFHSTLYPWETLNQAGVDFVVIGEGEITFHELILEMKKAEPQFETIPGLGFRINSQSVINADRQVIENLDMIPYPDYHLVDIKRYSHVLGKNAITISIQTSRGCPFSCIFCDIRRTKFRFRSAPNIVKEISYWYDEGISSFFIVDDNFVINRQRLMDICSQIETRKMKIDFKISARVNSVDREMLQALKKAGCSRINFGVESGHQKYLDYLEKGITPAQTEKAFSLCHESGIETFAYMMIGILGETREEMYAELNFLKKIKSDYASFSVCSPYPKTKLYTKLLAEGIIKDDYWKKFADHPLENFNMPLVPGKYSPKELRNIQADITRRYYLSPHVLFQKIRKIRNFRQLLNAAYLGMRIILPSRKMQNAG